MHFLTASRFVASNVANSRSLALSETRRRLTGKKRTFENNIQQPIIRTPAQPQPPAKGMTVYTPLTLTVCQKLAFHLHSTLSYLQGKHYTLSPLSIKPAFENSSRGSVSSTYATRSGACTRDLLRKARHLTKTPFIRETPNS